MEGDYRDGEKITTGVVFQSTPSAWRETDTRVALKKAGKISIHSLRMEGDKHNA